MLFASYAHRTRAYHDISNEYHFILSIFEKMCPSLGGDVRFNYFQSEHIYSVIVDVQLMWKAVFNLVNNLKDTL